MSFDNQLKNLMKQINDFKATDDNSLPQNAFYLNENQILCCERDYGVSRFAYDANGLVVWARSSGHIDAYDSTFTIFREANNFEDASIAFMGGIKQENGEYYLTENGILIAKELNYDIPFTVRKELQWILIREF